MIESAITTIDASAPETEICRLRTRSLYKQTQLPGHRKTPSRHPDTQWTLSWSLRASDAPTGRDAGSLMVRRGSVTRKRHPTRVLATSIVPLWACTIA